MAAGQQVFIFHGIRNIYNDKRDYLRGFGYQGGAGRGRGVELLSLQLVQI